jgi:hypothetical protein
MENRRSRRKPVREAIEVTNALTGEMVGHVGNLSVDGMLLIANRELVENALFQFAFDLPEGGESSRHFEIGVHEQWGEPASTPGQHWFGFRIIDIAPADRKSLSAWVDARDADEV